jgi:hypothetical protein
MLDIITLLVMDIYLLFYKECWDMFLPYVENIFMGMQWEFHLH